MTTPITSNGKLLSIRRQQRSQQLSQIRNSLRFMNQFELHQPHSQKDYSQQYDLTEEKLLAILKEENLETMYEAITQANFQGQEILEKHAIEIVQFLRKRLTFPMSILSMGNLVNHFQVFAETVLMSGCFQELMECLTKLATGSQSQAVYLWTLCSLTDRPNSLSKSQMVLLLQAVERIFKNQAQHSEQNYLLIRLIKNLSESNQPLNDSLMIYLANYFWKVKTQASKLNIYLTCYNLISRATFNQSTTVLLHLLAVCLKGKKHLEMQDININQMLPDKYSILISALNAYNEMWECMETECDFQIQGTTMKLGVHSFLFTFQPQLFANTQTNSQYLEFLYQFCKNSPIELTVLKWLQIGTMDTIVSSLTATADLCFQSLKILQRLLYQILNESSESFHLLQTLKSSSNIYQSVGQALYLFHSPAIIQISQSVLSMLQRQ